MKRLARHKCYDKTLWNQKRLVSCVCTVPNARNTQKIYCIRRNPSIWYWAKCPEPLRHPHRVLVSVGRGCGGQRGSAFACGQVRTSPFPYDLRTQAFMSALPLCSFTDSFQGFRGLVGIQVSKKGVKVYVVPKLFASTNTEPNKMETRQTEQLASDEGLWTEGKSGGIYCTMLLSRRGEVPLQFSPGAGGRGTRRAEKHLKPSDVRDVAGISPPGGP